ncbi:hypothetical protein LPTSP4_09450 [Leptospira ryugenii]|uniref:Uncharacterized protein n=1 Tax=Leptospira ryugenii TaxID=1917863 RepID=A0A2P2DXS6_9LEPT|nr:hypothetical protein [Leptospira ryugenii]GBF49432.1 hypothetical protein LPTSP4_09450 [Leptospira ryugenii]
MEINIKNNAGELKIATRRVDSEYKEIEYSIELNPQIDFNRLFSRLEPMPYNVSDSRWVSGYKGKLGIIKSDTGRTIYSGLRDLSINTNKLKGIGREEYGNEHFHLYLKSFINRFIYLDEIIFEL